MKKILITGANSYIGDSVKEYLIQEPENYSVDIKDTINWTPKSSDFIGYDVVFNVAGIAHIKETSKNRHLYYEVNRNLVIKIAKAAKKAGVQQFILLSTMSVYGLTVGHIKKDTPVHPTNAYGKSKAQADMIIKKLEDDSFRFACLRPPMVYGKGCKGNYQGLRMFAIKSPIFPNYANERSMIYIGNLCEFIKNIIEQNSRGIFFPQNENYVCSSKMVELIAKSNDRHIYLTGLFNWAIKILKLNMINKVFGSLTYEPVDLVSKYGFDESIRLTEKRI